MVGWDEGVSVEFWVGVSGGGRRWAAGEIEEDNLTGSPVVLSSAKEGQGRESPLLGKGPCADVSRSLIGRDGGLRRRGRLNADDVEG